jgi:transposase
VRPHPEYEAAWIIHDPDHDLRLDDANQVLPLRDHLLAAEVTLVVIEATSDHWKPFYYLMAEDLNVILVNARQVKNLPGRKTDVSDAAWLAQLGAHGLVRASFVPPQPRRDVGH